MVFELFQRTQQLQAEVNQLSRIVDSESSRVPDVNELARDGLGPAVEFEYDAAWRIDYHLATPGLAACIEAYVERAATHAERWYDHAPVTAVFDRDPLVWGTYRPSDPGGGARDVALPDRR